MSIDNKEIYEFGPFRLDVGEHSFERTDGEKSRPLPEKAFQTLVVLVRNRGRLVTKSELLDAVWPDSFVEDNNLDKAVHAVRHVLGAGPDGQKYIETVRKHGFRFVADVNARTENGLDRVVGTPDEREQTYDEKVTEAKQAAGAVSPSLTKRLVPRWPVAAAVAGVLLAMFALFSVGKYGGGAVSVPIRSIAVLPFANLSGDDGQEYLADGLTEILITDLAKAGSLRVISRPAVMRFKGINKPLPELGRELEVDAMLTGSVLRSGDRIQVAVQLTDRAGDRTLWTQTYERPQSDLFALEKQVVRDIVAQIRVTLTSQEQTQFGRAGAVSAEAFDAYLRGKFYLHRQTAGDNAAAVAALESAVAADPTFAAAQAELAQAYVWKLYLFSPEEKDLAEKAFISAEKALSLDPNLAVAHLARGRLLWTPANRFPHDRAIREYRRALELDPNLDEARNQLSLVYSHIGAFDEAMREAKLAVEINPGNNLARFRIGEIFLFRGEFEQALTGLRNTPENANPALVGHLIVWTLLHLGRGEEASAALDQFHKENLDDNRGLFTSLQAVMAAAAGRGDEAEAKIRQAIENGKGFGHFHHSAFYIACAYALMNKREQAMNWLESASEDGFPCYVMFENEKYLANLREEQRFKALMVKLKERWGGFQDNPPR